MTDAAIPSIARHAGLLALHIGNTPTRGTRLGELQACGKLWQLQLGNCWLAPGWSDGVARLTSLRDLELSYTNANSADIGTFRNLPRLQILSLRGSAIDDGAVEPLLAMPSLTTSDAEVSGLSETGKRRLEAGFAGRVNFNPEKAWADQTAVPDRLASALAEPEWTKVDFAAIVPSVGAAAMASGGDPAYAAALRDSGVPVARRPLAVERNRWCSVPVPDAADVALRVRFRMGRGAAGQRSASFRLRESDAGGVGITIHDSGIVSSGIFRWHETPAVVGRSLSWQAEPVRDEQQTVILAAMGNKCHVWFKGRYYRFDVEGRTERGGIGFGWLDGNANMVIEQAEYRVLE